MDEGDAMTDTKALLQKIAALRMRMAASPQPASSGDLLPAVKEKIQRGSQESMLLETTLRSAEPAPSAEPPPTVRLTGRGANVLRKGRALLQSLRQIADDLDFQGIDASDALADLHTGAMAMLEVLLRTAQSFPATVSEQLRLCDGLDVVLTEIEERVALITAGLAQRKHTAKRIDELADYLHALAVDEPVGLAPLQSLAETLVAEARAQMPLQFLYASPSEPARFAAAHSLTVAQVMARVLLDDPEWQPQLSLALMAALVHDVGMVRVPAELLLTQGPLDMNERRLIEKHTTVAEAMLERLWPGGGWPIDAARDHHERTDGTGYPQGSRDLHISSYVRLLSVCDVYAALCAERPHRPAFDTRTALTEILLLAERGFLDSTSAERLLRLSFYPIGSVVELNDGSIALVIGAPEGKQGIANPGRPVVQIILDPQGRAPAWPAIFNLLDATDRSIVRGLRADERKTLLGKRCPPACI